MKVLVIDDDEIICDMLKMFFESEGHECIYELDAETGLEKAQSYSPQIVMLDVVMPGKIKGYDITRTIKADPALRSAYVMVMSGNTAYKDLKQAKDAGADDFLAKPFSTEFLKKKLRSLPIQ